MVPPLPTAEWILAIETLQASGAEYNPRLWKLGVIGYNLPPWEFEAFDDRWLLQFIPEGLKNDLPRPYDAPRTLHAEWRRRALLELYLKKKIDAHGLYLLMAGHLLMILSVRDRSRAVE